MKAVKVFLSDAEKTKQYLIRKKLLSHDYIPLKKNGFIYFPVVSTKNIPEKYFVVTISMRKKKKRETDLRKKVDLTKKELQFLKTAFDTVGTIAILEVPEELRKKEMHIANRLLEINTSIKTVLRKEGIHSGVFRTQKLKWLAGKKTKEALYKEHNVRLKLDVEKVYFSPRLSTERKRIYKLVKKGERVLVMFSGCAPYPCVLSKNTQAKEIYGIEINPVGHHYGLENVTLNKVENVYLFEGDVRDVALTLKKKFDRILMPLPKSAGEFLDVALAVAKKDTIIHCYDFLHEDELDLVKKKVRTACTKVGKKCSILRVVTCGQYSPRTYRVCVDFVVH